MKLLAWDTSAKAGAIAALEGDEVPRLAAEWSLSVDAQHSERLLWGVHQVLEAARWRLDEVDCFAAGIGPGSFTGLRIGLTTARTLAHATGKPLIGVSSLAALARPAALWLREARREKTLVVAATDACKGEVFALWGPASAVAGCVRAPARGVREEVLEPGALAAALKRKLGTDRSALWLAVGEGWGRYPELGSALPRGRELRDGIPFSGQVQGRYLGMLAWEAWKAGLARPALETQPRYLRASDAELKLKAGLLA